MDVWKAAFHKDWELHVPNLQIWLVDIDIESSLDFPNWTGIYASFILGQKVVK